MIDRRTFVGLAAAASLSENARPAFSQGRDDEIEKRDTAVPSEKHLTEPIQPFSIVDAHQHFWDLQRNYLPWLRDEPPIPFRYGNYSALKRNYMPVDYRRDAQGIDVAGSVFVETEWDRSDPVGETRWVHELASSAGLPSVMVCHVILHRPDAPDILAQQATYPLVRGVRHKPATAEQSQKITVGLDGSMTDPAWRRGYSQLERNRLSFDLQVPWWHLKEALALNKDFPNIPMILNHTGLPRTRAADEISNWRKAMEEFATAPNVSAKISGLGEPGLPWTLERNRQIILDTIAIFGEDRCMFGSNFPVDSLVGSMATIFRGFAEATKSRGIAVQQKLFSENAKRIYRLPVGGTK
jgi:predicted TIM-barrel fold metal-dependent hydrolase